LRGRSGLANGALADALGHAHAVLKGAKAECKALKDEIKRRGLLEAAGDSFAIRVSEQISGRLDVAAVKQDLGESWRRFEVGIDRISSTHGCRNWDMLAGVIFMAGGHSIVLTASPFPGRGSVAYAPRLRRFPLPPEHAELVTTLQRFILGRGKASH
jgi:hypothetical protein